MSFITSLLGYPLGWIMYWLYQMTGNYWLSLLLFTLITRMILFPFTVKQQKSTVKMAMIKPELEELQKKYANNREKLNEEMMKLYNRVGYNPASGCLPLLIQFPILFGLIDVIYKPLTHILRLPAETIAAATQIVEQAGEVSSRGVNMIQLDIIRSIKNGGADFLQAMGESAYQAVTDLHMTFFGLDLTLTPSTDMLKTIFSGFNPVLLIPLISGLTSFFMTRVTTRNSGQSMEGNLGNSMKGMMYTMPIFSMIFTFSVPAGVGLYWTFSNVIGALQSMILNKFMNPREMAEKAKAEMEELKEKERIARIEAKKKDPNKGLSQKEINRRKLAEARKRDAEKYGEEYVEVEDSDLQ